MRILNRVLAALWLAVAGVGSLSATHVAASQFVPAHEAAKGLAAPLIEQAAFTGPRRALLAGQKATGPTWLGNFLNGVLPSGVSVSSPSLGGLVTDASGKLTYKPNNLAPYSNNLSGAAWAFDHASGSGTTLSFTGGFPQDRAVQTVSVPGGSLILSATFSAADVGKTVRLAVWDATHDGLSTGASPDLIIPASGKVYYAWSGLSGITNWGILNPSIGVVQTVNLSGVGFVASLVTYETTPRAADQVITGASAYYGPAWDYDPVNVGTPLGLRIWESRTNQAPNSEAATNWSASDATAALAQGTSPSGANTANTITDSATNNRHILYEAIPATVSQPYVASVFLKQGSLRYAQLGLSFGPTQFGIVIDLQTGTITDTHTTGSLTGTAYSLVAYGGGWYRLSVTAVASNATAYPIVAASNSATPAYESNGNPVYVGSGQYVYAWGLQLELGATASPYTPTSSQAVTAAADDVKMNGTSFTSWYNQSAGTFILNAQAAAASQGPVAVLVANQAAGDYANQIGFFHGNSVGNSSGTGVVGVIYVSSANQLTADTGVSTTSAFRVALAYSATGAAVAGNGTLGLTNSSDTIPSNIDTLWFGQRNGAIRWNGWIGKVAYYNTRLPNAKLRSLTQ